jgi:hypothetical protein
MAEVTDAGECTMDYQQRDDNALRAAQRFVSRTLQIQRVRPSPRIGPARQRDLQCHLYCSLRQTAQTCSQVQRRQKGK